MENFGRLLLFAVPLFEQVALLIRKEDPLVDQIPDQTPFFQVDKDSPHRF